VFLTVIVALGTAAPQESVTTPAILPVVATCPNVNPGMRMTRTNIDNLSFLISPPLNGNFRFELPLGSKA